MSILLLLCPCDTALHQTNRLSVPRGRDDERLGLASPSSASSDPVVDVSVAAHPALEAVEA